MTLDEAIKSLNTLRESINGVFDYNCRSQCAALDMAIKALEQQPCEDCISRQAAIDELELQAKEMSQWSERYTKQAKGVLTAKNIIEDLPLVTPQPKVGEWLEKEVNSDKVIEEWQSARCSVCNKYHTTPYMYYFDEYNYCPNCGAKMGVEE